MSPDTSGPAAPAWNAEAVRVWLRDLATALAARGLNVRVGKGALTARNPAVTGTDPCGKLLSPGLSQTVALTRDDDGVPAWYWAWTGPARDSPLELEYLCAAVDIERAAERIAHVLSVEA